jgi:hypothetical protein
MAASRKHPPAKHPGGGKPSGKMASTLVTLSVMGVVSVMIVGFCSAQSDDGDEVTADCVDLDSADAGGSYTVVDEDHCDDDRHYVGSHGAYSWYYGGIRNGVRIGSGTTVRPSDTHIVSRSGSVIQRGGFGGRGVGGG